MTLWGVSNPGPDLWWRLFRTPYPLRHESGTIELIKYGLYAIKTEVWRDIITLIRFYYTVVYMHEKIVRIIPYFLQPAI